MIKKYLINYQVLLVDGLRFTSEKRTITIPAVNLADAVDYAYNKLKLTDILTVSEDGEME